MMTGEKGNFVSEMISQAADTFSETMQTGLKFQQQSARFWTDTFSKNADQFRTHMEKATNDVLPTTQKNLERLQHMFDEQAQKSMDMLREVFGVSQGWSDKGIQDQFSNLWRTSFDAMRSSVDAVAKANTELLDNWSDMTRKACSAPAATKTNGKGAK